MRYGKIDHGDVCIALNILKTTEIYTSKCILNSIAYIYYISIKLIRMCVGKSGTRFGSRTGHVCVYFEEGGLVLAQ